MAHKILFCFFFHITMLAVAQEKPAYRIFSSDGKEVSYEKLLHEVAKAEVILFGELHDDPIAHWLELEVARSLYDRDPRLVMGMEMFEADDQVVLDEYLTDAIDVRQLAREAKVWDNYETDYRPLVDFARTRKLRVIGTNVPRRYANMVYRRGLTSLDSLSAQAKSWMVPLPFETDFTLSGYRDMVKETHGHPGVKGQNMALAQSLKDATMAYFILKNLQPAGHFLHINGAYHSENKEGIVWYLKKSRPAMTVATIHVARQAGIEQLEGSNHRRGDFIICVPTDMTKTH